MSLLHSRIDGDRDRPAVLLVNSLGTSLEMWHAQREALAAHFSVISSDARGHGKSGVPAGPYSIAAMGLDLLGLMDELDVKQAHVCGLSLGGMVGQWLAVHRGERVDRLVLSNTAAKIGTAEVWDARIAAVRAGGMEAIVPGVIDRWFTAGYQMREPKEVARIAAMLRATPVEGYAASCAAIREMDQRTDVKEITAPTLVIAGDADLVTPIAEAEFLAGEIAGARLLTLPAAHLANIEAGPAFTQALLDFLKEEV